jgi:putative transposase
MTCADRAKVRERLGEAGIRVVQTPFQAPNANAYAERFVRSIKQECLNRMIPLGERHLRWTIAEYVEDYHRERNHQGIQNELIAGAPATRIGGRIRCHPRLGGLLRKGRRHLRDLSERRAQGCVEAGAHSLTGC